MSHQYNKGRTVNANQGSGNQINHTYVNQRAKTRIGWAVLAIVVIDVAFFFYGQAAYSGNAASTGDMWRAGIFVVLLGTTGTLIRRWCRLPR